VQLLFFFLHAMEIGHKQLHHCLDMQTLQLTSTSAAKHIIYLSRCAFSSQRFGCLPQRRLYA
jgi:hypothetical protein